MLRNHGITRDKSKYVNKNNNGIYYEQQLLGYNYRLSDLHASLGLSQLEKIDRFYNKRLIIKKRYDQKLKNLPFIFPKYKKKIKFSNHLYILMIDPSKTNKKRDDFVKYLRKKILLPVSIISLFINNHTIKRITSKIKSLVILIFIMIMQ